jgi:hypothetical protein
MMMMHEAATPLAAAAAAAAALPAAAGVLQTRLLPLAGHLRHPHPTPVLRPHLLLLLQ